MKALQQRLTKIFSEEETILGKPTKTLGKKGDSGKWGPPLGQVTDHPFTQRDKPGTLWSTATSWMSHPRPRPPTLEGEVEKEQEPTTEQKTMLRGCSLNLQITDGEEEGNSGTDNE